MKKQQKQNLIIFVHKTMMCEWYWLFLRVSGQIWAGQDEPLWRFVGNYFIRRNNFPIEMHIPLMPWVRVDLNGSTRSHFLPHLILPVQLSSNDIFWLERSTYRLGSWLFELSSFAIFFPNRFVPLNSHFIAANGY
jgi:hypothetical protein